MSVRITGLQEVATLQSGDYIAIDNESNGTHKFDAMKMGANMASNIAPAYSTAATYAIGDFCMHDGILYKCTTAISTPESWTASHWTQTSAGVALAQKVDKVSGKGLSQNDFTNTLKTKLDGIASGAEVNVQANWTQTNTSADDYIKNKPVDATSSVGGLMSASDKAKLNGIAAGAEVNVQANWTETNTSSDAYIKNKPTNATSSTAGLMSAADKAKLDGIASGAEVNVQADWSQTNTSADDYIKNKPVDATSSVGGLMSATDKAKLDSIEQGAEVNVQANWSQTNTSADDYIKNKPTNATTSTAGLMSASDKTKLNGIETGAQVNVIDGVKVDGTLLTVDGNKDVDIVGKANQASLAPQYSSDTGNYVRGNYVIYQNNLYKCLQDTSGVWDATKWEQVDIGDDLEQKANIDGLYEEMTVGGAEQLISDTFNIESVPYNFRTSGGSLEIGDRETDKLIGGTVAWNQLVQNGNFADTTKWNATRVTLSASDNVGTLTASSNSDNYIQQGVSFPQNHKIFYTIDYKANTAKQTAYEIVVVFKGTTSDRTSVQGGTDTNWHTSAGVFVCSEEMYRAIRLRCPHTDATTSFRNVFVTDLTALFGTTIANYIYSLEQNTTGAGVAFFKKLFPAPYYAYNAGQLMSVNAGSHVMNGFNQWDEEWEVGKYNASTGAKVSASDCIRNKNYISVLPNTTYYAKTNTDGYGYIFVFCYDANKNYIGLAKNSSGYTSITNQTFVTLDNTYYINFYNSSSYGTTYKNNMCISLSWDGERNGEYEPYVSHTYELDDTLELRGIPKLDANNQLYYDGDVYESDGTVTRKYGIVDLGTLTWDKATQGGATIFYCTLNNGIQAEAQSVCSKYPTVTSQSALTSTDKTGRQYGSSEYNFSRFAIHDSAYDNVDAAAFQTAMSGVYLVYELATPTTESATPYTNPQIVDDWGTETYTDYSYDAQTRDVQIPVGHETRYMANLKAKLEMAPESPTGDGDYIVRQTSGENAYVAIGSSPTIQHKAEIDGTYDDMNVGGAKQLLSNVFEEDQVPYTFRTSGGSIDIGDREYDTVVGGTVAWNQLYQKHTNAATMEGTSSTGLTITVDSDGYVNISGTPDATCVIAPTPQVSSLLANHVGLILCDGYDGTFAWGRGGFTIANNFTDHFLNKHTANFSFIPFMRFVAGTAYNVKVRFMGIDLTQMFGSTIADYIYSLEQATAGAGVAWFRKLFPKPYYEYNAGELLSVEGVSSHDMTGFNQWDEEWELGSYSTTTGAPVTASNMIRSKSTDYFNIVGGATYYAKIGDDTTALRLFFYDADKNYISSEAMRLSTITAPDNARYGRFHVGSTYGTTYKNDICINLHWDGERDGEYEPYELHTYALDDSLTLRGIPKLDASNNLYYDGDTYESDGTVTRGYEEVDIGNLTMTTVYTGTTNKTVKYSLPSKYKGYPKAEYSAISSKYAIIDGVAGTSVLSTPDSKAVGIYWYSNNGIPTDTDMYIVCPVNDTPSGHFVYKLAEPTTETADPFQSPQIVDDWGTEEYVTTSIVPVGHDTKYTANLRAKIEMAPDSPSGDGDYIVRQVDGTNSYVPLVIPNELPAMPTTDGTYRLQVVVASGTPTLSWVSAT